MDSQSEPQDGPPDAATALFPPLRPVVPAPVGGDGTAVSTWFDRAVAAEPPVLDGTLEAERDAADAYARMAKAENTRRAYRAAVPGTVRTVHATKSLASARRRRQCRRLPRRRTRPQPVAANLKLRRAAIRHLHRAAGAVPTDDVCVAATLAGIQARRGPQGPDAPQEGRGDRHHPAPHGGTDPRRPARVAALLLVGFAGALPERSVSSIWRRPPAASASPCRTARARRTARRPSPCPMATPSSARCTRWTPGCRPPASPKARCSDGWLPPHHAAGHPLGPGSVPRVHAVAQIVQARRRRRLRGARPRRPQPQARRPDHRHGARHPSGPAETARPSQKL